MNMFLQDFIYVKWPHEIKLHDLGQKLYVLHCARRTGLTLDKAILQSLPYRTTKGDFVSLVEHYRPIVKADDDIQRKLADRPFSRTWLTEMGRDHMKWAKAMQEHLSPIRYDALMMYLIQRLRATEPYRLDYMLDMPFKDLVHGAQEFAKNVMRPSPLKRPGGTRVIRNPEVLALSIEQQRLVMFLIKLRAMTPELPVKALLEQLPPDVQSYIASRASEHRSSVGMRIIARAALKQKVELGKELAK